MVSLLEYRKRKQGSGRDAELSSGVSTPQPGPHYSKDPPQVHQPQMQPPASPHTSFSSSSSSSHTASVPQIEEVSPPEQPPAPPAHTNNQWMVPTTVERLREGQGALERVLRSIKMERVYKRSDGSTEKDSEAERYEMQAPSMTPPRKSPHTYSPSVYPQQSSEAQRQTDSPSFLQQTSSSPFPGSYSPTSGQVLYPRLSSSSSSSSSSHPGLSLDQPPPSYPSPSPASSSSESWTAAAAPHQQGGANVDGAHAYGQLKAGFLNSGGLPGAPANPPPGSRGHSKAQPQAGRGLKSSSPAQGALQAGSRLLAAPTHYPQRGTGLTQFQHSPLQGPGVRTQSGSF